MSKQKAHIYGIYDKKKREHTRDFKAAKTQSITLENQDTPLPKVEILKPGGTIYNERHNTTKITFCDSMGANDDNK